jgi:hypothetical protein
MTDWQCSRESLVVSVLENCFEPPWKLVHSPMKNTLKALIAAGTALLMTSSTHAEIPSTPKISIAPLFGKWVDASGRWTPHKYIIGPRWIAVFYEHCGYRYRYRVVQSEIVTVKGEKSWEIGLDEWDPVFLGKNITPQECLGRELPKTSYMNIGAVGVESVGPQWPISLTECATEDDFKKLIAQHSDGIQHNCRGWGMQSRDE